MSKKSKLVNGKSTFANKGKPTFGNPVKNFISGGRRVTTGGRKIRA